MEMAKQDFFAEACKQHHTRLRESASRRADEDIFSVHRRPQTAQLLRVNVERHTRLLQKDTPRSISHEDCCGYCERYCEGKITAYRHREIEAWTRTVNRSMQESHSAGFLRTHTRYPNYHPPGAPAGEDGFRLVPTPKSLHRKQLDFSAQSLLLIKQAVAAVRISPYVSQESINLQRDPHDSFNFQCCYETVANGIAERQDAEKCNNVDNNSADFDDKLSVTESSSKEHEGSRCESDLSAEGHGEVTSRFVIKMDRGDTRHPPSPSGEQQEGEAVDTEHTTPAGWCLVGHGYTQQPTSARQSSKDKNVDFQDQQMHTAESSGLRQENANGAENDTVTTRPVSARKQTPVPGAGDNKHSNEQGKERKVNMPHCIITEAPRGEQNALDSHLTSRPQSGRLPVRSMSGRIQRRASVHNPIGQGGEQDKPKEMRAERYASILRRSSSTPLAPRPLYSKRPVSHTVFSRRSSQVSRVRPSTAPPRFMRPNRDTPSKALNIMLTSRDVLQNNAYRGLFKYDPSCQRPLQANVGSKRFQQMNRALVDMVEQGEAIL